MSRSDSEDNDLIAVGVEDVGTSTQRIFFLCRLQNWMQSELGCSQHLTTLSKVNTPDTVQLIMQEQANGSLPRPLSSIGVKATIVDLFGLKAFLDRGNL
ncbi:hypothetical protein N7481_010997 [Penicillium waksmanii]|uniref:uncharacterized protein n=1 Tax=Penicillium waksmanii TaxID=69791 RepID=UPI0025489147|nr:uncharacterized protein N7481_010997 [Penicillium waksmanii]KAJ5973787.1 hypothetical protein N7481_010997 [Penicillium waksmanii]